MEIKNIEVCKIIIPEERAFVNESLVSELAKSISKIGLIEPIIVAKISEESYEVISGVHRLEAVKKLGYKFIQCIVIESQNKEILTARIDSNLIKKEISVLEKAELLKAKKDVYNSSLNELVKELGITKSLLSSYIEIAENIDNELRNIIKTLPISNKKKELSLLAKLDKDTQRKVIEIIRNNDAKTVSEALKIYKKREFLKNNLDVNIDSKIVDLRFGDFREVLKDVKDIDVIITDPPYGKKYLHLWNDLALFAKEHLKDDGFLVTYCGNMYLPEVISSLSQHMYYVWTFALYHKGKTAIIHPTNVINRWKPILIYSKRKTKFARTKDDVVISEQREKDSHPWQQSISGINKLISYFSHEGDLICDPFMGSGTTAVACIQNNRRFVGAEIDEEYYNIAKARINNILKELNNVSGQ